MLSRPPRLTQPRILALRPGSQAHLPLPIAGDAPMDISIEGLPAGLAVDAPRRILTGSSAITGRHRLRLRLRNAYGVAEDHLTLVINHSLCLTPPMGWNHWNCFGMEVTQDRILAAAEAIVSHRLQEHGWNLIAIDDGWQGERDAAGRIHPNAAFPDLPGLCRRIHDLGLRVGIYSSPGRTTCGGMTGSLGHEEKDAARYAAWGVDYLKYDLCSYMKELHHAKEDVDRQEWLLQMQLPYRVMGTHLARQSRDIIYSLCQYGIADVPTWGAAVGGHLWRTTADITDTWASVCTIGFGQHGLEKYAGPGRWNDPDMLVLGRLGWGQPRANRLTAAEQRTHFALWSLLAAPLLLGCDLTRLDVATLDLLTNDEVLAVNQDVAGCQGRRCAIGQESEVWRKDLADGGIAIGLFNRSDQAAEVSYYWIDEQVHGPQRVRDLFEHTDLGVCQRGIVRKVDAHGVCLLRLDPLPVG